MFLVKQFDEKYRIWDNVMNIDQKYKISEKAQNAAQTAQHRAQAALQTPTGQKVHELANQTLAQIAAVHYEAKKIQVRKSWMSMKHLDPLYLKLVYHVHRVKS